MINVVLKVFPLQAAAACFRGPKTVFNSAKMAFTSSKLPSTRHSRAPKLPQDGTQEPHDGSKHGIGTTPPCHGPGGIREALTITPSTADEPKSIWTLVRRFLHLHVQHCSLSSWGQREYVHVHAEKGLKRALYAHTPATGTAYDKELRKARLPQLLVKWDVQQRMMRCL